MIYERINLNFVPMGHGPAQPLNTPSKGCIRAARLERAAGPQRAILARPSVHRLPVLAAASGGHGDPLVWPRLRSTVDRQATMVEGDDLD